MADNWVQRQFDPANFVGTGSMTWTLPSGPTTDAYIIQGKTVTYSLELYPSTTGGTASNELRIILPSSIQVLRTMNNLVRLYLGSSAAVGYFRVGPAWNYIRITNLDLTNLPLTSSFGVNGEITFEIA